MEKEQRDRIKRRAEFMLQNAPKLDSPLSQAVISGDAKDTFDMLSYIEQLERKITLLSLSAS